MLVHISSLLQCTCIATHLTHENTIIYLDTICQLGMSEHDMQSDCNQIRPVSNVANWLCSIKFISCLQYILSCMRTAGMGPIRGSEVPCIPFHCFMPFFKFDKMLVLY